MHRRRRVLYADPDPWCIGCVQHDLCEWGDGQFGGGRKSSVRFAWSMEVCLVEVERIGEVLAAVRHCRGHLSPRQYEIADIRPTGPSLEVC